MNYKNIEVVFILVLLIIFLLVGCGDNQFDKEYSNFKKSYLKVTDVLDLKEPFTSIEKLNTNPTIKEIEEMKIITSKIKQEASSESEMRICNNISKYYSGLEFLQYAAKNKNNLSENERGRIATELTLIEMNRNRIKQNEV